jgi:hypothetical protein
MAEDLAPRPSARGGRNADTMSRMHPAGHFVRAGVARADRLRRSRETARRAWRVAPIAAAISVAVAAGSRWAGWPVAIPLGALALGLAALAAYVYAAGRDHAVSDRAAAEIDAHAGLGGELRSAHWFEARETTDPWVELHLGRADARVQEIDWARLYPAVRARRAKAASVVMAVGALALALVVPGRSAASHTPVSAAAAARARAAAGGTTLPPDLQKELEDLLNAAESGTAPSSGRPLTASELHQLLARISELRALQAAKDAKADPAAAGARADLNLDDLKPLADRLKKASEIASLSPEMRDAFAEAAEKLTDASDAQTANPKDPREAAAPANAQKGDAAKSNKPGDKQDASVQSVKDASAGGGAGVVMMSNQDQSGGKEPGLGLGGGTTPNTGGGQMPDLGAALRKETIEAKTDNPGENVETELRRKTERGDATVAYSNVAPRTFGRGRSSAPPAVPEGRRAAVHSYFIRKQ